MPEIDFETRLRADIAEVSRIQAEANKRAQAITMPDGDYPSSDDIIDLALATGAHIAALIKLQGTMLELAKELA